LQHVLVEAEIRNQLLQAGVLLAQVLDLFGLAHFHPAVLGLPGIDRVLAHALFPRNILGRAPRLNLLQRRDDLRLV
jgi:hypothetical protein